MLRDAIALGIAALLLAATAHGAVPAPAAEKASAAKPAAEKAPEKPAEKTAPRTPPPPPPTTQPLPAWAEELRVNHFEAMRRAWLDYLSAAERAPSRSTEASG